MLSDREVLNRHRIAGKTTDCEVELPQYASIFVAEKEGVRAWIAFTPQLAGRVELSLPVAAPAPAPAPAPGAGGRP
jgi:hypothetical protein